MKLSRSNLPKTERNTEKGRVPLLLLRNQEILDSRTPVVFKDPPQFARPEKLVTNLYQQPAIMTLSYPLGKPLPLPRPQVKQKVAFVAGHSSHQKPLVDLPQWWHSTNPGPAVVGSL